MKVSYRCIGYCKSVISKHNTRTLFCCKAKNQTSNQTTPETNPPSCNCRKRNECPLKNNCQINGVVYKAQVLTDNSTPKEYIGMTGNSFKEIFNNHTKSFNNKIYKNSTELSKYVWHLKEKRSDFTNKWSIQKRADSYSNGKKSCNLYNGYYTIIGRD